jgi:L-arabinokinase
MSEKEYINVAYYITGHGLGHATRSVELIRGLLKTGKVKVHTITTVDEHFFIHELVSYGIDIQDPKGKLIYQHWHRNLDTGGIQKDVIYLDPFNTLDTYYSTVHLNRNTLLEQEVIWAKEHSIDLILMDATQFGSAVAKFVGAKSVLVTNFTWDFIFEGMLAAISSELSSEMIAVYQNMIDICSQDIINVDYYIQYPGDTPLRGAFDRTNKIIPGPLISRPVHNKNLRNEWNIPFGTKLLLLGFGGHATDWRFLRDSFLPEGWHCLILRAEEKDMPSNRFHVMPQDSYIPDLIYATDAVLGKIGYGFVSECLSAGTALIYIPRVYWPEEAYLENVLVNEYHAGVRLPLEEYNRGNWTPYILEAERKKNGWIIEPERHPTNATAMVVETIGKILNVAL